MLRAALLCCFLKGRKEKGNEGKGREGKGNGMKRIELYDII